MKKNSLLFVTAVMLLVMLLGGQAFAEVLPAEMHADENGFLIADGVLYGYQGDAKEIIVPDGVTEIAKNAFYCRRELRTVTLPASLKIIGDDAFHYCSELKEVLLPEGLLEIGERAFSNCGRLSGISIPDSIRRIGREAFYRTELRGELVLPSGITVVEDRCFVETKLTSVSLPYGVTRIGEEAFRGCAILKEVSIPETVQEIGKKAFAYCGCLEEVYLPEGLDKIAAMTFFDCSSLRTAVIPSGVTVIGQRAFTGCENLTDMSIPDSVREIGAAAFLNCTLLEQLGLPSVGGGEPACAEELPVIQQLIAVPNAILVLQADGTVLPLPVKAVDNSFTTEECVLSEQNEREISCWTGISKLARCNHMIIGLKTDGTAEAVITDEHAAPYLEQVSSWKNVRDVENGYRFVAGIRTDGTVAVAGEEPPSFVKGYSFFDNLAEWTDVVKTKTGVCGAGEYAAGLRSDGTIVYEGIYDVGWSGPSDQFVDFACSGWMLIGVREDGGVSANGEDSSGALAFLNWKDMKQVACGDTEAIGLKKDGTLLVTRESREELKELTDVERIELDMYRYFVAYRSDGSVWIDSYYLDESILEETRSWKNIKQICIFAAGTEIPFVLGLKSDGTVVSAGIDFEALYREANSQ